MKTLACTLALAAAFTAGAAAAETARVTYGDLDVSRPADAQALARRIQTAATNACQASIRGELKDWDAHARCAARVRASLIRALPTAERDAYARATGSVTPDYVRAAGSPAE